MCYLAEYFIFKFARRLYIILYPHTEHLTLSRIVKWCVVPHCPQLYPGCDNPTAPGPAPGPGPGTNPTPDVAFIIESLAVCVTPFAVCWLLKSSVGVKEDGELRCDPSVNVGSCHRVNNADDCNVGCIASNNVAIKKSAFLVTCVLKNAFCFWVPKKFLFALTH